MEQWFPKLHSTNIWKVILCFGDTKETISYEVYFKNNKLNLF